MLKFLLGLLITIVGVPLLTLFLLLDFSPDIPYEDFEQMEIPLIVEEEINSAISNLSESELKFSLSESNINKIIYNSILESVNPDYNPGENCTEIACEFIQYEELEDPEGLGLGVTGIWVKLYDDIISVNIAVKAHYQVDFQTRLRLEFQVVDNAEKFEISYHKIQVGTIPLPKFIVNPVVNLILEQTNFNPDDVSNEYFTVDTDTLTVLLDKTKLVDEFATTPEAEFGMNLFFEEELLKFEVVDEGDPRLELFLDIEKLETKNYEGVTYSTEASAEEVMAEVMLEVLGAFTQETSEIVLSEDDFNVLLSEFVPAVSLQDYIDTEDFDVNVELDNIFVDFTEAGEMLLHIPIVFNDRVSDVILTAVEDKEVTDSFYFEVVDLSIGYDEGETEDEYIRVSYEEVSELLAKYGFASEAFEFNGVEGYIEINYEAFEAMFEGLIDINDISINNNSIEISFNVEIPGI